MFKDIHDVAISHEFLLMASENNFHNLNEICKYSIKELMQKPGMNYRMLAELGSILDSHGLIKMLREA